MKRCKVSSAASWEPAHVNLENVEEFLHFLIERPAKTQRRRVSLWISRWWDYFQSFNDPQICSVDVGSHVRVGSSAIVVWNLPHLQNWWTAARATQQIIEKTGSIPIVRFTTNPKENQLSSSLWRVLKPFDAYENFHSQTKFIRRRTSFSY